MEIQIRMVSAAGKVFSFKKKNPMAIPEDIFQEVADYINEERIKNERIKLAMIGAAGKAFEIITKNPRAHDKILFKEFMDNIPELLSKIDSEENQ